MKYKKWTINFFSYSDEPDKVYVHSVDGDKPSKKQSIKVIEHQAYTDLKQQADMLYEALEVISKQLEVVNINGAEEIGKLMSTRTLSRHSLKTYKDFIKESEK